MSGFTMFLSPDGLLCIVPLLLGAVQITGLVITFNEKILYKYIILNERVNNLKVKFNKLDFFKRGSFYLS